MTRIVEEAAARRQGTRLWAEFVLLYAGVPLALAYLLPPRAMFTVLFAATAAGVVLLHRTPGFSWRELGRGPVPWRFILVFALVTVGVAGSAAWMLFPGSFLSMPRYRPELWLAIMALYPVFSALPQEILFRPLFFRRYGGLFPSRGMAVAVNAGVFALAHLMYGHPLVLAMTASGGLVFAWLYAVRGSFWGAVIAHVVAGQIVFTVGLGILFYSGAVR